MLPVFYSEGPGGCLTKDETERCLVSRVTDLRSVRIRKGLYKIIPMFLMFHYVVSQVCFSDLLETPGFAICFRAERHGR